MTDYLLVPVCVESLFVARKKPNDKTPDTVSRLGQSSKLALGPGVHLHWFLPAALTKGLVDPNDTATFPKVPNRWLVTRRNQTGKVAQWVVESDYIHPEGQGEDCVAYPLKRKTDKSPVLFRRVGRKLGLDEWQKNQTAKPGKNPQAEYLDKLTAIGYGVPAFAAFYPNCYSVFGFHDEEPADSCPEYTVLGWYSDPADDFLGKYLHQIPDGQPVADALRQGLNWETPGNGPFPNRMFCYGAVSKSVQSLGVEAKKIAVANNDVDAISTFLAAEIAGGQNPQKALIEEQLEFLSIQPNLANDRLDLDAKFAENWHQRGFNAVFGGLRWILQPEIEPNEAEKPQPRQGLPLEFAQQLTRINLQQQEYDRGLQELLDMQQEFASDLNLAIQRVFSSGKNIRDNAEAARVERLTREQNQLRDAKANAIQQVKEKLDQWCDELKQAITRHNQKEDARHYALKQIPSARYWQPREPVVLFANTAKLALLDELDKKLECRVIQCDGSTPISCEPALKTGKSAGNLPAPEGPQPHLIFLEWRVSFSPTRAESDRPAAAFAAGQDYPENFMAGKIGLGKKKGKLIQQKKTGKAVANITEAQPMYFGSSILSAHAHEQLRQRISKGLQALADKEKSKELLFGPMQNAATGVWQEYLAPLKPPLEDGEAFQAWLGKNITTLCEGYAARLKLDPKAISPEPILSILNGLKALQNRKFLSQALTGFNDMLIQKQGGQLSNAGLFNAGQTPDNFSPIRAGVLKFRQLNLVDTFGRTTELPFDEIIACEDLRDDENIPRQVTLPPRLIQAARLNFRWLAAGSGFQQSNEMNSHPATHPICGWLLPNFLENSLLVYDQAGVALGALLTVPTTRWRATPGSKTARPEDIQNVHLRKVVVSLASSGNDSLDDFLSSLGNILENIAPQHSSGEVETPLLMGQPLAVARASLKLEIFGNPAAPSGADRQKPRKHAFGSVRFPIQLGDDEELDDGLVGCWLEDEKGTLRPPFCPAPTDIQLAVNDPRQTVTLLLDPHGKVHAASEILPVKAIDIPPEQYSDLLDRLELIFLAAPIITSPNGLNLPLTADSSYRWAWRESQDAGWKELSAPAAGDAKAAPQEIREVWLKLAKGE